MGARLLAAALTAAAALVPVVSDCRAPAREAREVPVSSETRPLTPEEARIIEGRGTERPFTGAYWDLHDDGTYRCRRCGAPLFSSGAKFDSGSGWPSFDSALPGAVREVPDPDGHRTEIVCAGCGAHLGHVFTGEGFTQKNVRHCVNSASLAFEPVAVPDPAPQDRPSTATAYFAGGCFWGVEYWFDREPGVLSAESGYMGGHVSSPGYRQVCGGDTGHAEAVRVTFDPAKTSYEKLARLFFEIHDPTQVDGQGPDLGDQYRSAVFCADEGQRKVADRLVADLRARGLAVVTRVEPAGTFWPAETYHQDYYRRKGEEPYCHVRVPRFGDAPVPASSRTTVR